MCIPQQLQWGLALNLLPIFGIHFPTGLPCLASVREDVPSPEVTLCAQVGWHPGGFHPFQRRRDRGDMARDGMWRD